MPRYMVERSFPNGLSIEAIHEVSVLDPYFSH
jgi:hypothetical protein